MKFRTLEYQNGVLTLIDQRILPLQVEYLSYDSLEGVIFSIADMVVRGAPAIGAAAGYGFAIGIREIAQKGVVPTLEQAAEIKTKLDASRPTAVNLMWATQRMLDAYRKFAPETPEEAIAGMDREAQAIYDEDVASCKAISDNGASLVEEGFTILTHCNAGALATTAYGTAVGVITAAHDQGKKIRVYADETRPRLQGARLTSWELFHHGVPVTLISDSVAATLIRDKKIDMVVVGADRIAANGDTANKIGTFMLSAMCKWYNVPFYIAAPLSTIDFDIATGAEIEIETRSGEELRVIDGVRIALEEIPVFNPAFDVSPHENITAIITDRGIARPPYLQSLQALRKAR
ncbi:MAG: S-methyl-5-thioribose-1-phosphate isomerase [Bacillota bacterium]|nr:S-methyl-5-thioribose-1-phosphate isomerase [Bacillota bacterium]